MKLRSRVVNKDYRADIQWPGSKQVIGEVHLPMSTLFLTEEARIHNGAKTASSINGAGKTGQLHVKE